MLSARDTVVEKAAGASFFRLWIPTSIAYTGAFLATFGLNWWLAQSPGGGPLLGMTVGAASLVALIVVATFAGAIDRAAPATVFSCLHLALAATCALLLICYLSNAAHVVILALGVMTYLAAESMKSVYFAAAETALADLAPSTWASSRTATLVHLQRHLARLIAPLIGGTLLAIGLLWSLPSVSFLSVIVAMATLAVWPPIPSTRREASARTPRAGAGWAALRTTVDEWRESTRWIARRPLLLFLLVVASTTNLIVFPFYSMLPLFIAELSYEHQALLYGYAASAYGVGVLLTSGLIVGWRGRVERPAGAAALIVAGCGVILVGTSAIRHPVVLVCGVGLLGALMTMVTAVDNGAWLDLTPSAVRVRIFSLRRLVGFATIPVGTGVLGLAGASFGFTIVLRCLIVVSGAALVVAWWWLRASESVSASP